MTITNRKSLVQVRDANQEIVFLAQSRQDGSLKARDNARYIDTYADRDASTSVFSAGVGMPLASGLVSLSLELSKLSFEKEHIFGYPEDITGGPYNSADLARVEDTRFRVGVGYNLSF